MKILAAFTFFTRLPFWKIREIPQEAFKDITSYWPLVGWLTGGFTAAVLWACSLVLPLDIAIILAIVSRLLLTGGLHEDGLADFFDGFGGGTTKARILAIMKDSFIGSYGVMALVLYFALLWGVMCALPMPQLICLVIAGDVFSKFVASQLPNVLPYARNVEESKAKVVYNRMKFPVFAFALITGILPLVLLLPPYLWIAAAAPVLVFGILYGIMKHKLQGYTGDCCGATFLLSELSFYLGAVLLLYNQTIL